MDLQLFRAGVGVYAHSSSARSADRTGSVQRAGDGARFALNRGVRRFSISDLKQTGLVLNVDEALAITQQLVNSSEPCGHPSEDGVFIDENGRITTADSQTAITVLEAGALLQALIPSPIAASGSLRYAIARALCAVEAPPFESLEEFSQAIGRFERSDRSEILRGLASRAFHGSSGAVPAVERRRTAPRAAELRRHLREADQRLYDQQLALGTVAAMTPSDPKSRHRLAVTIVALGMTLSGAAAFAHWRSHDGNGEVVQREAIVSPPAVAPRQPVAEPVRTTIDVSNQQEQTVVKAVRPAAEKPAVKRAATPRSSAARTRSEKPRWNWLRGKITFRSDPL